MRFLCVFTILLTGYFEPGINIWNWKFIYTQCVKLFVSHGSYAQMPIIATVYYITFILKHVICCIWGKGRGNGASSMVSIMLICQPSGISLPRTQFKILIIIKWRLTNCMWNGIQNVFPGVYNYCYQTRTKLQISELSGWTLPTTQTQLTHI